MSLITFSNISVQFDDKPLFSDFSLSVDEGEKVLISGKSGNGKSTLLRILLGFSEHTAGEILVNGKTITPNDFSEVRKQIAYVNQDVTLRPGIVRQVLAEVAKFSGNTYDGGFDEALAEHLEFDLTLLDKKTEELSGGERQRLGIILATMLDRPVFLLDEVTSALDKELKRKVADYFANCDKTVISVSHDPQWVDTKAFREVEW